ncbi:flagellar hook protein [Citrobacter koseri]|uniref:Flagellar hook protein FlgE n=1 Tax=Citrobacter koseri TaxID=545 RepID=A0A2X2UZZ0_CITKO|nr:flagellar hook protein [Citrobacter koseri]
MSFNIATSGLNAITEQLNAISNNIANSGTVGFKSGRAEFSSLYAESQPLGVGVSGVTQSITRGGNISTTGNALDLAISDSGFFMVRDSTGTTAYTRAGYFGTDSSGNLINNLGMYLQGYPVNANGEIEVGDDWQSDDQQRLYSGEGDRQPRLHRQPGRARRRAGDGALSTQKTALPITIPTPRRFLIPWDASTR